MMIVPPIARNTGSAAIFKSGLPSGDVARRDIDPAADKCCEAAIG